MTMKKLLIYFLIAAFAFVAVIKLYQEAISEVVDVTVEKLVTKSYFDGHNTTYRYLVVTDKGTYICEDSFINGKFNNSDIFYHFKENKRYRLKVTGYGKGFFTDYKNIIDVTDIK